MKHALSTCAALLAAVLLLAGCGKTPTPDPTGPVDHTVLIYMIANHSGSVPTALKRNVYDAMAGVGSTTLANGRLLVYFNAAEGSSLSPRGSALMEIRYDHKLGGAVIDTLKVYGNHKSIDPDVMQGIFADARAAAPAASYGLIMGSHGTGWFPAAMDYTQRYALTPAEPWQILAAKDLENAETRAFGIDGRNSSNQWEWMEIEELAAALHGQQFDYVLFDACFMCNIETLYALRRTGIEYFIASPAEIMAKGFPYDEIVPYLFTSATPEAKSIAIAQQFMDYYRNRYGNTRSAAISVVKSSEIEPLAAAVKEVLKTTPETDRTLVHPYEALKNGHAFFDLDNWLRLRSGGTGRAYADFTEALGRCIVLHDCTEEIYSNDGVRYSTISMDTENICGLNCYIPSTSEPLTVKAWEQTAWYSATH